MKLIDRIKLHDWYVLTDIMTILGPALIFIIIALLTSCSVTKEIPVQTIEKIEIRDSLIYVRDTVEVPVPYEVVKEVIPDVDTSYLETSLAKSTAYLESSSKKLHHTLEQKGTLQTVIDTFYITQIKEVEKLVEVPVEVVKEVKYTPTWCWWTLIYAIVLSLLIGIKLYLRYCQRKV